MAAYRYIALVRWTDPAPGVSWQGERRYRFAGRGSKRLEAAFAYGAKVRVYYPPGRPSRFIIDITFAPTMADLFLRAGHGPSASPVGNPRQYLIINPASLPAPEDIPPASGRSSRPATSPSPSASGSRTSGS